MQIFRLLASLPFAITLLMTGPALGQSATHRDSGKSGADDNPPPPMMVLVPGGEHRIGITEKQLAELTKKLGFRSNPEKLIRCFASTPAREVELPAFYIDKFEVRGSWYAEFLKDLPAWSEQQGIRLDWLPPITWRAGYGIEDSPGPKPAANGVLTEEEKLEAMRNSWEVPEGFGDRPATAMSFHEAVAFCEWMGRRLPREVEWEAAARMGSSRKDLRLWPWGDECNTADPKANTGANQSHPQRRNIAHYLPPLIKVGAMSEGASAVGAVDMVGNAWEFTSTLFAPYPKFRAVTVNRRSLRTSDFPPNAAVIRGGDALKPDYVCSSFYRDGVDRGVRAPLIGFRTAASLDPAQDRIAWILRKERMDRWLADIPRLDPIKTKRGSRKVIDPYTSLASDIPTMYALASTPGFNLATMLPQRSQSLLAISRKSYGFRRGADALRRFAEKGPIMIGYLKLDVPTVKPALEAGEYLVWWENSFEVEESAEAGKEGEGEGAKSPPPVPESVYFQPLGQARPDQWTRITEFPQEPFTGPTEGTSIDIPRAGTTGENDRARITFEMPLKFKRGKDSFKVIFDLEFAEGKLVDFLR